MSFASFLFAMQAVHVNGSWAALFTSWLVVGLAICVPVIMWCRDRSPSWLMLSAVAILSSTCGGAASDCGSGQGGAGELCLLDPCERSADKMRCGACGDRFPLLGRALLSARCADPEMLVPVTRCECGELRPGDVLRSSQRQPDDERAADTGPADDVDGATEPRDELL